ncbi:hypothetical protein BVC71_15165 [Marivivens niveibacter]|uniref:Tetratricopeptide repeat protein n=2 Tax=Marivivens niveibacter TaxID=1930667 RepID=A0A251WVQ8_9RHOB|nr:hypothetical protein BVC71_15165 [Marivivens niveibacter]
MVLTGLASVAFACFAVRSEFNSVMAAPDETQMYLSALQEQPVFASSLSNSSHTFQMRNCDDYLASVVGPLFGRTALENVATSCEQRASEILAVSPNAAVAHLVRADALAIIGQPDEAFAAYERSYQLAPSEGWLATRRLRLAFRLGAAALGDAAANDAKLMVESHIYRPYLVDLYQSNPAHREWLASALEGADPGALRTFLRLVRQAAQRGTGL